MQFAALFGHSHDPYGHGVGRPISTGRLTVGAQRLLARGHTALNGATAHNAVVFDAARRVRHYSHDHPHHHTRYRNQPTWLVEPVRAYTSKNLGGFGRVRQWRDGDDGGAMVADWWK